MNSYSVRMKIGPPIRVRARNEQNAKKQAIQKKKILLRYLGYEEEEIATATAVMDVRCISKPTEIATIKTGKAL